MNQSSVHCAQEKFRSCRERGQTIALVAISMVSLLAMAALAIDLTTLYVAKGEIQRAADTAALAGAKAFVDTGVTTYPSKASLQNLAQSLARSFATAAAAQNNVAGYPAQLASGSPTFNFNLPGNPRISLTLQRTGLPLFFARIWGNSSASVSATAIAEAYNPAYSQANTFVPAAPKCVKPFLVPNNDPIQSGNPRFVDPATGAVNSTAASFIGEQITLTSACVGQGQGCNLRGGPKRLAPQPGEYLPMRLPDTHQYCPSPSALGCSGGGPTDFELSAECCDGTVFDFRQCGASATAATWDNSLNPGGSSGPAQNGLQCLIHTTSTGTPGGTPEQDTLSVAAYVSGTGPLQISPGSSTQTRYGISANSLVGTSDSIITVPLFDNTNPSMPANQQITIVGFLQLFVNYVGPGQNDVNAYILNVVGCGSSTSSGTAVSGGGASPIPVRLVHN
jgi:hypothetical protein